MCKRWFMLPWDFIKHLDTKHRKCKSCQGYLKDNDHLWEHMQQNHPDGTDKQVETEPQVTIDPANQDTSLQDHQVKCKYCTRYFKNMAECNMHVKETQKH